MIEVTEADARPFREIDERFAFDYGEGDRSLKWWRENMWDYYSEVCRKIGREPSQDMPLACQRFRLLYKRDRAKEKPAREPKCSSNGPRTTERSLSISDGPGLKVCRPSGVEPGRQNHRSNSDGC